MKLSDGQLVAFSIVFFGFFIVKAIYFEMTCSDEPIPNAQVCTGIFTRACVPATECNLK